MFRRDKYAGLIKKVTGLNDRAVQAESNGEFLQAVSLIDETAELAGEIKPYRLLNWIVEYNYTRYHHLYDSEFDKQICMDMYFRLKHIVKNNMSASDFESIKDLYGFLLLGLLSLMVDGNQNDDFGQMLEEIFSLSNDGTIEKAKRDQLYISASGLAAAYQVSIGNYAVAIHYVTAILDLIEFDAVIDENKLFYLNQLLFTYEGAGQIDHAVDLGRFLYVKYLKGELQTKNIEEIHRLILGYTEALAEQGHHRLALRIMNKSFDKGIANNPDGNTYLMNLLFVYIDLSERCKTPVSDEIYEKAKKLLDQRRNIRDFRSQYVSENASLDLSGFIIAKARGEEYKSYLDKVYDRYAEKGCPEGEFIAYSGQMTRVMKEYWELGELSKVRDCGRHIMIQLYKYIQYAQYYVDNDRMLKALNNAEFSFLFAYSALLWQTSEEQKFEYILNYKNLLPTVVRRRDTKMENNKELRDILNEVNAIKDLIAQKSSSIRSLAENGDEIARLRGRLAELENLFSVKYGKKEKIPHYSLEDFKKVIPDNSIVIDLFFSKSDLYLQAVEDIIVSYDNDLLETFVWVKNKDCQLYYHKNTDVEGIINLLSDFIETIQDPHRKYKKKAKKIYKDLFGECIDNVEGIEKIYICPHLLDANLPFDLIFNENPNLEKCKVVYLQTIRELFFETAVSNFSDMCIVGNPSYRLNQEYNDDITSGKRGIYLVPLPFSEYEARSIARICGNDCFIGKMAMKNRIKSGYRMFHIATHGFSEREGVEDVWYSSALSFAGIIDWLDSGIEHDLYGNGILTADEISRMNLKGTDLVVLSACNSGNSLFYGTNHLAGLHIAFATAGVQYIVSSLWKVDDFATAILMQLFTEEWTDGKPVEIALYNAKKKMQIMTVEEIYKYIISNDESDSIPAEILENLKRMGQGNILFAHPYYWDGFICYQNLF